MIPEQINELSILVSALLAVAIETIWYSPLVFGQALMRLKTQEVVSRQEIFRTTALHIIAQVFFFVILVQFVSLSLTYNIPLYSLVSLLIFYIVIHIIIFTLRERNTFTHFLIHAGYSSLTVLVGIGVIVFWPW